MAPPNTPHGGAKVRMREKWRLMLTVTLHIQDGTGGTVAYEATLRGVEGRDPRGRLVTLTSGDAPATLMAEHGRALTSDEAGRLVRTLSEATVKPLSPHAIGRGGTFFMLKIERGFNTATFTWWNTLPAAWEALNETVRQLTGARRG